MSYAEIKKAINSDLEKPLDTLIKDYLANTTYGLSPIKTFLNTINANLTVGKVPVVKSVQRGFVGVCTTSNYDDSIHIGTSYAGKSFYLDIKISSINQSKSIVLVNNLGIDSIYGEKGSLLIPVIMNSTTIRFYTDSITNGTTQSLVCGFSWQVIEFY